MINPRYLSGRFPLKLNIWALGTACLDREQLWLSASWDKVKTGTPVSDDEETTKLQLALRAIALGLIYLDFCYRAWDLDSELLYECESWAEDVGIDRKSLIKLANAAGVKLTAKDLKEEPELFTETVLSLANGVREEVFDLLCPDIREYPQLVEELCAINKPAEFSYVMDKVGSWFSEKCGYPLQSVRSEQYE